MICDHWTSEGWCGAPDAHPYVTGIKCPKHTPAREGGRPEPAGMYPEAFPRAQEFYFHKSVTTRKRP